MESVMSSFRLLMAENNSYVKLAFLQLNLYMVTSICAGQPQSVRGNLNLCRATSICAKQPQSVQNNLNSCKTTSIRAEKKKPKSNGLFQRDKMNFRTQAFFSGQGTYRNQTFCKKFGREMSRTASAMAETICPPHIEGRHPMLYFNIQRTEKYSIAMCQSESPQVYSE